MAIETEDGKTPRTNSGWWVLDVSSPQDLRGKMVLS